MTKKLLIALLILAATIAVVIIIRHNYELSSNYNYITAKLDIKNGDVKLVNVGDTEQVTRAIEINIIAARYGFQNVYLSTDSAKNEMKGIKNYNELIEAFLNLRNGNQWKESYQKEVDSLLRP